MLCWPERNKDILVGYMQVREKIINGVENFGFRCKDWIESPLKGAEGNIEFLACFSRAAVESTNIDNISTLAT